MKPDHKNLKGVVFDVDGTLYYQAPLRIIMLFSIVLNNIHRPARLLRTVRIIRCYRSMQERIRKGLHGGAASPSLQLELTARQTGEIEDLVGEVVRKWMEEAPLPYLPYLRRPGLIGFMEGLKERGIKLGVYSDYPCSEKLSRLGIGGYFSAVVTSFDGEVQSFKPAGKGFSVCLERLGVRPEEAIYIGDRESVDAAGAEWIGMTPMLIGSGFRLKASRYRRYRSFNSIRRILFHE